MSQFKYTGPAYKRGLTIAGKRYQPADYDKAKAEEMCKRQPRLRRYFDGLDEVKEDKPTPPPPSGKKNSAETKTGKS